MKNIYDHQAIKPVVHKYTIKQEEQMKILYLAEDTQEGRDAVVEELAERWDRPKKSIIAKMSKAKYYVAKQNVSKLTGVKPETKEQLVRRLTIKHQGKDLEGLEKAPKKVLLILLGEA